MLRIIISTKVVQKVHTIDALTGIKFNLACAVNDSTGKSYFHTHEFHLNLVQRAAYLLELRLFKNNMTLFDHISHELAKLWS